MVRESETGTRGAGTIVNFKEAFFFAWLECPHKLAVPFPVGVLKKLLPVGTFVLNTSPQKLHFFVAKITVSHRSSKTCLVKKKILKRTKSRFCQNLLQNDMCSVFNRENTKPVYFKI